jgi:hypothetical protein
VQNVLYLLNCVPLSANAKEFALLFAHRALAVISANFLLIRGRVENVKCVRQKNLVMHL